jgi:hypothetical protein
MERLCLRCLAHELVTLLGLGIEPADRASLSYLNQLNSCSRNHSAAYSTEYDHGITSLPSRDRITGVHYAPPGLGARAKRLLPAGLTGLLTDRPSGNTHSGLHHASVLIPQLLADTGDHIGKLRSCPFGERRYRR